MKKLIEEAVVRLLMTFVFLVMLPVLAVTMVVVWTREAWWRIRGYA